MTSTDHWRLEKARELMDKARDPNWLDELYEGGTSHSLEIWHWAESNGLEAIQAGIASAATIDFMLQYRGAGVKDWRDKLLKYARHAKSAGRLLEFAGFMEAVLPTGGLDMTVRAEVHEELYNFYRQFGNWPYATRHACAIAYGHMRSGRLREAGELLVDTFKANQTRDLQNAIIEVFLCMGTLLAPTQPVLAGRILHRAKQLSEQGSSKMGIPASERLRAIQHDYNLSATAFESSQSADEIVREFQTALLDISKPGVA